MVNDPHNVRERLYKAVSLLARSSRPIQKRLNFAVMEISPLRPEEFLEPEARETFTAIIELATASEDASGSKGSIENTTANLSDEQAEGIAEMIVQLDVIYRPISGG